jgi:CIC family chloride channel protein
VTSIIMIFEMTNNYSIILPLMIANIISYATATELSHAPIYDALLQQDDIHLPHNERQHLKQLRVRDAMVDNAATLSHQLSVAEALQSVQALPGDPHLLPVVDEDGRLVALLTPNDLKRALADGQDGARITAIASHKLVLVYPDHSLDQAMIKLGKEGLSQLPVVSRSDTAKLLGIISIHDIAKALSKEAEAGNARVAERT